jgi:hypothetical protein
LIVVLDAASLPAARRGLRIHPIGSDGEFQDAHDCLGMNYGMVDGDLLRIRPDGYVGALVTASDVKSIEDYLAHTSATADGV